MTVQELIIILKTLPPEARVCIEEDNGELLRDVGIPEAVKAHNSEYWCVGEGCDGCADGDTPIDVVIL